MRSLTSVVICSVGFWWSPSLCLCVPLFYSQWFVLQHLTLPSSFGCHSGCFAAISISMADAWPSLVSRADALPPLSLASSLVDALLPSVSWSFPLRMLCRRVSSLGGCLAAVVVGGCFAAVAAGCSLLSGWIVCHQGTVLFVGNHCVFVSFSCRLGW